jgi:L-alanine-DL-glutamate epimerase-like enolase superfamily enzyme
MRTWSDAEVQIDTINARGLSIPFKVAFKHASAERSSMQSLWVEVRSADGETGMGEGCPREYVTSESLESAQAFVERYQADWLAEIHDVESLRRWVGGHGAEIDAHPAAWSAVEIAILDLMGKSRGVPIEALLDVPAIEGQFRYTAVLGDASPRVFEAQLAHYVAAGFRNFKIKLSGDHDTDFGKTRALASIGVAPASVRADANNLWSDPSQAIDHLAALNFPFFAIEEPLQAGNHDGMRKIAGAMGVKIIVDESALYLAHLEPLRYDAQLWIVNLRVSKMGGLVRSIDFVRSVRRVGVKLIIGAHVGETSVLTRAALTIANLARDIVVAQEGAFGTQLLEHDVVDPPLMFGAGGVLASTGLSRPGLGLGPAQKSLRRSTGTPP